MIKCQVCVCGAISRGASVKKDKEDNPFVSFGVKYPVIGRDKEVLDLDISVTTDGGKDLVSVYTTGRRVEINGVLIIRKKDGRIYLNLRADEGGIKLAKTTAGDKFEGTIEFKGKIGKNGVDEKPDKRGNTFKSFSAFSSDRNGDKTDFTWVRFLYFNPKDGENFLQANAYVECHGDLRLGVYKGALSLDCLLKDVAVWELNKQ